MKKIILILFLLIISISGKSQTIKHENATAFKDNIKKIIAKKDSIKATKTAIVAKEIFIDSIVVPKGTFKPFKLNAHASYYADKFTGRRSASGKTFDNNKYMAAHKTLPFGTKIKVTNPANNKTVYVEVVDRGPFVKGRELDLSKRAFMEIVTKKGSGAVIVTIEQLQK